MTPESTEERILDLLVEWDEQLRLGKELTPEELCPDDAALREALRLRLRRRRLMQKFLDPPTVVAPEAESVRHGTPVTPTGYELLGVIGHGGMGIVYKARHRALDRLVALKMILGGASASPALRARLRTEAQAVAQVTHPNVVQIYEVGEVGDCPYLALEYVPGGSLAERLDGTPLSARQAAEQVRQLARAMDQVHQRNIVHRDLKPANVLLAADGSPKVTDFGLAKLLKGDPGHTHTGAVVGSVNYMAPEQAEGRTHDVGPAADTYALGAILYGLLTGRPPFVGETAMVTLEQVRHHSPVPPRRLQPSVPRDLETVCLKCLSKEPHRRYATAQALADDLGRFLDGLAIQARPTGALERAWRWSRRNPVVASLLTALVVVFAAGFGGVSWKWYEAVEQAQLKDTALNESQANLYLREISLAQREWLGNRLDQARKHLAGCPDKQRAWEWYYLDGLLRSTPFTLPTGQDLVTGVTFSPNGMRLATSHGDDEGTVKVWESATGRLLLTLSGGGVLSSVAFSPDGKTLAVTAKPIDDPGYVRLWDATTGADVRTLRGETPIVGQPIFSPDGRRLAAPDGPAVRVWDAATGEVVLTLRPDVMAVSAVAFSPDGKSLATGSLVAVGGQERGQVKLWDAVKGTELRTLPILSRGCSGLAFGGDGRRLAARGGGAVKVWDVASGVEELTINTPGPFAFGLGGGWLATAEADHTVTLWDLVARRPVRGYRGHRAYVQSLAFSSDGRLAAADAKPAVLIWDAKSPQGSRTFDARSFHMPCLALSPDGGQMAVGGLKRFGPGESAAVWTARPGGGLVQFAGKGLQIGAMAFSADGRVATAGTRSNKGEAAVWDATTGRQLLDLKGHAGRVRAVAFSPDGTRVASAGDDRVVRIWDATGRQLFTVPGTSEDQCVAFDPDGRRLAALGEDARSVRLWDAETGQALGALEGHTNRVLGIAFSPDGRRLATASRDKTVKVWDTTTGDLRAALSEFAEEVVGVAYSPDGRRLFSAAGSTITLSDPETPRVVLTLENDGEGIVALALSADGRRLAVLGHDRVIRIWESDSPP